MRGEGLTFLLVLTYETVVQPGRGDHKTPPPPPTFRNEIPATALLQKRSLSTWKRRNKGRRHADV